jgi:hypothetical protein
MESKVWGYGEINFSKIAKLDLHGKAKDWFKKLQPFFVNWNEMKIEVWWCRPWWIMGENGLCQARESNCTMTRWIS